VNTHIAVESARSALYYAAWRLTVADETAYLFVSAAKVLADRAYQIAAGRYIQVLGGLGFTMEMPGHLFARRAMFNQQSMGAPDVHLGQIAQRFADSGSRT
jgi:alkylation response protein AidB-like acyl-CoA dehydrogenase